MNLNQTSLFLHRLIPRNRRRISRSRRGNSNIVGSNLRQHVVEQLEARCLLAGEFIISELMASNSTTLNDVDGESSDWFEIHNTSGSTLSLNGYHLTDDATNLTKWTFPDVDIDDDGFLLVFASSKDRTNPLLQLHTNFNISGSGEYIALVEPDGSTIAHDFSPTLPTQLTDISYGISESISVEQELVGAGTDLHAFVPPDSSLGSTWTGGAGNEPFDDSAWLAGDTSAGFDQDLPAIFSFELDIESQLAGQSATAYLRYDFSVNEAANYTTLQLDVNYDDGFVAYLNGTEVARRNSPATPLFNSTAATPRDDALAAQAESIDITSFLSDLREGDNVLAFQVLNESSSDSNLLLAAELSGDQVVDRLEQYYTTPTPGAENIVGALGLVQDTKFSVDRGFYFTPFHVEISTDTANAEIRYTLDGTRPTATTGLVYSVPIDITTTSTLRAASFRPGYLPSNVDTQTYIFPDDVLVQDGSNLPTTSWGHAGPDWAMDPEVLNNLDPATRPEADDLLALGTVALSVDFNQFFGSGGIYPAGQGVEIATSFELFDADGVDNEQIDASVQIVGGSSTGRWKSDKLSMRVKFSEEFGPTKFNYPVFGSDAASQYDTLVIDAQLNNVWHYGGGSDPNGQRGRAQYVRDQLVADLQNATGGYAPHGRHVHVYINGIYWGLHMLHERPDDNFISQYLGGNAEDYDVVKHTANNVVAGTNANYLELLNAANQDMTVQANYDVVDDLLDMENFIDYMLVNYYLGNTDWAHHNWYASFNRV
ncbi:MAG: hypothetical protein ACI9HK_004642, partial [Pirellulaceae bacterium]